MLLEYGVTVCPASWRVDEKIPAGYCRVYYVTGGTVHYADSQQKADLQHETLYIFPSAAPYRMRQVIADPLRCTFMHLDFSPLTVTELIAYPVQENSLLKHLLQAISASILDSDYKLLYALADTFELFAVEHDLVPPPVHSLAQVLLYIEDHIEENITLDQLSAITGYNEQYFIRLFRRRIGITPYQYIISQRLKAAKKLLIQNETITRVAEMTGYRDIKAFSRAFKKSFGITPSEFRKNRTVLP